MLRPAGLAEARPAGAGAGRPATAGPNPFATPSGLAGLPDYERELRGFSSVEMELRYGGPDVQRRILGASGPAAGDRGAFPWGTFGRLLKERYADLHRHFIFEYYPWYHNDPWRHWQQWSRVPPHDIAVTSVPQLGPYSSRDNKVIEQHARWIKDAGAGAINLSWWGRQSFSGGTAHQVMDVMRDHDIKVMFHIEPYARDRNHRYAEDITYLIQEYGNKRGWDTMLVLTDANGKQGPVFKSFRTIVAPQITDCHGVVHDVPDYTDDSVWVAQLGAVRDRFREDFDHVTMLADSLNMNRTRNGSFDGVAIYNNFLDPRTWHEHAMRATDRGLVFSFNCNPGFDSIARRVVPEDSCYVPNPFHPPAEIDFSTEEGRELARKLSRKQIRRTLATSLFLQVDEQLQNVASSFFLVFLNSFNEWHEGHAFEPAKPYRKLTAEELQTQYHNARNGKYRIRALKRYLNRLFSA